MFPSRRLALFVHGCFWHGHDCARGARSRKTNAQYWAQKIERNRRRDAAALDALSREGGRSCVIWECELKDLEQLRTRLVELLKATTKEKGGAMPVDMVISRFMEELRVALR